METEICRGLITRSNIKYISGFLHGPPGSEAELKASVALRPVSVGIDALDSLNNFKTGVYYDAKCTTSKMNNEVLVVGYGTTKDNVDYWLIRNSWGTTWGDNGYFKLARNRANHCGVSSDTNQPIML